MKYWSAILLFSSDVALEAVFQQRDQILHRYTQSSVSLRYHSCHKSTASESHEMTMADHLLTELAMRENT